MSLLWTLIHGTVQREGLPALVTADRPADSGDHHRWPSEGNVGS
jgi:hypothetical protein